MTLDGWRRTAAARLSETPAVESPAREAASILAVALDRPREWVAAHGGDPLPATAADRAATLLERRAAGEPLAYLRGWQEFWGRRFAVDRRVLIPRPETEHLVERALAWGDRLAEARGGGLAVLDLGTGSGCVAITMKLERPGWRVAASDVSAHALAVASANAAEWGADVEFRRGDGPAAWAGRTFDLVATNPPYVGRNDALGPGVREWEPAEALFAGDDGLDVYRSWSEELHRIVPSGVVVLEHGAGQAEAVAAAFSRTGWHEWDRWRDWAGHDRGLAFGARPPAKDG